MVTKQDVSKFFVALRKAGYVAKQNFCDCQSCGWAEIESKYPGAKRVVFYHAQDSAAWDRANKNLSAPLYLCWAGNGYEIIDIAHECGLRVRWPDENPEKRISILP